MSPVGVSGGRGRPIHQTQRQTPPRPRGRHSLRPRGSHFPPDSKADTPRPIGRHHQTQRETPPGPRGRHHQTQKQTPSRPRGRHPLTQRATEVDSMHPTGMHSCILLCLLETSVNMIECGAFSREETQSK